MKNLRITLTINDYVLNKEGEKKNIKSTDREAQDRFVTSLYVPLLNFIKTFF